MIAQKRGSAEGSLPRNILNNRKGSAEGSLPRNILNNRKGSAEGSLPRNILNNRKGQVTIFIIIAILLVSIILFIAYFNGWFKFEKSSTDNPKEYVENCMLVSIKEIEDNLIKSNTYPNFNSENYILFEQQKIPYLCTVSEFYKPCIPQDPAMIIRVSQLMENKVTRDVKTCLENLYEDFDLENYQVTKQPGEIKLDILPNTINVKLNETIYVSKGESSYTISGFELDYGTKFYDTIRLIQTIVNYESTLCEFNKLNWMKSYPEIIISTTRSSDQTKIYSIKDRLTDREIKFAIKTCVLPAGI